MEAFSWAGMKLFNSSMWHISSATPLYFMFALGTLPAGWLGDRLDRLMLIAVFFAGCGLASIWIAIASGPVGLMFGLGALGLFAAIYHPVGLAHVTQIGLRTGRALAVNGVFGNMGLASAAATTGLLSQLFGWQSAFAIPGLISLLLGCAMFLRNPRARKPVTHEIAEGPNSDVITARKVQWIVFGVICVAALFGGMVFNMVTVSLPKFLDERLVAQADVPGGFLSALVLRPENACPNSFMARTRTTHSLVRITSGDCSL